jgi:hypothetical protein
MNEKEREMSEKREKENGTKIGSLLKIIKKYMLLVSLLKGLLNTF